MKYLILSVFFVIITSLFPNNSFARTWYRAESTNFVVISNLSQENTKAYITNLENFRTLLNTSYFANKSDTANPKLEIYLLRSENDFAKVMPKKSPLIAGVATNCITGQHAVARYSGDEISKDKDSKDQNENNSQIIIFHEYTHIFMFQQSGPIFPLWFIEGFADFYGTVKISEMNTVIGMASSSREQTIYKNPVLDYKYILRNERPNGMKQNDYLSMFYAESWLLTHYMITDGERRKKLSQYLIAIQNGEDSVEAFEKYTGINVKDLPKILLKYLSKLEAKSYSFKQKMNAGNISISPMPEVSEDLLLWDASLKTCLGRRYKKEIIEKIRIEAAKSPDNNYAAEILARSEIIAGDEEKAIQFYKKQIANNPSDKEALFRLGQTYFIMAKNKKFLDGEDYTSQIKNARTLFYKSYKIDDLNPENLYYFSLTSPNGYIEVDDASFNAAIEAYRLAPSVSEYAMNAAYMLIGSSDSEQAKQILSQFANMPHGGAFGEKTKEAIKVIEANGSKEDVIKKVREIYNQPHNIDKNNGNDTKNK
jgi:hypothetical protein